MRIHCILFEGTDARDFAQAQFSADVSILTARRWQWNAWLTPQGRVCALMQLADPGDDRLLAILRGGDANRLSHTLDRFRLRRQVALTCQSFVGHPGPPVADGTLSMDGNDIVIGCGSRSLHLLPANTAPDPDASGNWRRQDIILGWPTLPPGDPRYLPPALGLERLGAVSFVKGCYPGQEIAARLHYRGVHKQRLYHLRGAACTPGHRVDEATPAVQVLDCVTGHDTADVLAVGPRDLPPEIRLCGGAWHVVSRFDA